MSDCAHWYVEDQDSAFSEGNWVRFMGCSDTQAMGYQHHLRLADPRQFLKIGEICRISHVDEAAFSTGLWLDDFEQPFNSVCFKKVAEAGARPA